jgi:hypothetical protein
MSAEALQGGQEVFTKRKPDPPTIR